MPSFTSGCPSLAFSLARRMVQAMAISHPPPSAKPFTQAITGLPRFSIRSSVAWPLCVYALASTALFFASSRSEEHTSELQSHSDLVCRLLLEKKKKLALNASHHITELQSTC